MYPWDDPGQYRPYISDIGASRWGYPLFIAGSAVTIVVFNLSFVAERWLRHTARLAQNYKTSEKILSGFAIAFAIIGGFGLLFLTIFNTHLYPHVHVAMLLVFMSVFPANPNPNPVLYTILTLSLQRRLYHLSNLHLRRISASRHALPRTPHPPRLILDKTHFHLRRTRPMHSLRCFEQATSLQPSRDLSTYGVS
jgi:hypothetical membrane protein